MAFACVIIHTVPAARGMLNSDVHTHANAHRLTGPNLLRISPIHVLRVAHDQ